MHQTVRSRLVLAALIVAGAVAFSVSPAGAQFASRVVEVTGLGGEPISVTAGEGGVEVFVPGRVDTNITNEYVPVAGDAFGARVPIIGPVTFETPQEIVVTGTPTVGLQNGTIVNFTPEALALMAGQRTCADYPIGNNTLSSAMTTFPAVPGQQVAAIKVHNFGPAVDYVACWRASQADGGPPPSCAVDAGVANMPLHSGDTWVVDGLADHHRLRCLTCTHAGPPSGGTALAGGSISICTPSL